MRQIGQASRAIAPWIHSQKNQRRSGWIFIAREDQSVSTLFLETLDDARRTVRNTPHALTDRTVPMLCGLSFDREDGLAMDSVMNKNRDGIHHCF